MKEQEKLDPFKQFKDQYKAGSKPAIIQTTPAQYLAVEGRGAPGGPVFQDCIGALYAMAFTIKMTRKFAGQGDYAVCKLEGLWFAEERKQFCKIPQDQWRWKLMIRTPDFIKPKDLDKAVAALLSKGKAEKVKEVKLEKLDEGRCVQMLHVGPYDKVGDTIAVMEEYAKQKGLSFLGAHHEIYLSDPRRVEPARLKTILRHSVR
jgi:hypothetical protein